jgi:hypothetical protein
VLARSSRRAAALLALGLALLAGSGCGSSSRAVQADLRLQREDLIAAARALARAQRDVAAETLTTKAAWPVVAGGLPASVGAGEGSSVAAAARGAAAVRVPSLFEPQVAAGLTGPGAGIAGTFRAYAGLSGTGWRMIQDALRASAAGGSASGFARSNSPLYIESVYDGHFGLAQVGKNLTAGYRKLGGPASFGDELTQQEVDRLAAAYSEPALRLHPHPAVTLGS